MLGIVRLFSEQVRETEKEAQTCLRRMVARATHLKASSMSLMDNLVEKEVEAQDLLDIWKANRHVLEMIDCSTGAAPLLPLGYLVSSSPRMNRGHSRIASSPSSSMMDPLGSTIWRDQESTFASTSDDPSGFVSDLVRGNDGNDGDGGGERARLSFGSAGVEDTREEFVSIPREGPVLDWDPRGDGRRNRHPSSSSIGSDDGEVETLRGEENEIARRTSLFFANGGGGSYGDFSHEGDVDDGYRCIGGQGDGLRGENGMEMSESHHASSSSTHFLDLLIDRHGGDGIVLGSRGDVGLGGDGFDDDGSTLRSMLDPSSFSRASGGIDGGDEDVHYRLIDLLVPASSDAGIAADEPILNSLYAEDRETEFHPTEGHIPPPDLPPLPNERFFHGDDGGDDGPYVGDGSAFFDGVQERESLLNREHDGSTSLDPEANTTKKKKTRRILFDEDTTKMAHEESRRWIEKLADLPPRSDHELLSDAAKLEFHVKSVKLDRKARKMVDIAKVMGMPKGRSFFKRGAWAYVYLLHSTRLSAGLSSDSFRGSMADEECGMLLDDGESMEVSRSVLQTTGTGGGGASSSGSSRDLFGILEQLDVMGANGQWGVEPPSLNDIEDGGDWIRTDLETNVALDGMGAEGRGGGGGEEDRNGTQPMMMMEEQQEEGSHSSASLREVSASRYSDRGSSILSSLNRSNSDSNADRTSRRVEVKGLSKALLGYLAVKAAAAAVVVPIEQEEDNHQRRRSSISKSGNMSSHDDGEQAEKEEEAVGNRSGASSLSSSSSAGRRGHLTVANLVRGAKRSTAAKTFHHLLELANLDQIQMEQLQPFGEIFISVLAA